MLLWFVSASVDAQTGSQIAKDPALGRDGIVWRSSAGRTCYVTVLDPKILESKPQWQDDAEHPPVSARQAINASRKVVDRIKPYGADVRMGQPSLRLRTDSSGHWFWVVHYSPDDFRRYLATFPVVVLMSGEVVEPVVDQPATDYLRSQSSDK
jgi:hypothetical protein